MGKESSLSADLGFTPERSYGTQLAVRLKMPLPVDSRMLQFPIVLKQMREFAKRHPFLSLEKGQDLDPKVLGPEGEIYQVKYAGVCGSDRNLVKLKTGLSSVFDVPNVLPRRGLSILSLQQRLFGWNQEEGRIPRSGTLGHEAVVWNREGRIGVLYPIVGCPSKFSEEPEKWCLCCKEGQENQCQNTMEGRVRGLAHGTSAVIVDNQGKEIGELGGAMTDRLAAYKSQFIPLPEEITPKQAIMTDAYACAVNGVESARNLGVNFSEQPRVLIIGMGSIGFSTFDYLARRGLKNITVLTKYPTQAEIVRYYNEYYDGNFKAVEIGDPDHITRLAGRCDSHLEENGRQYWLRGNRDNKGGFDVVFECVGSPQSVTDAHLLTAPNGYLVELGLPAEMDFDFNIPGRKQLTTLHPFWAPRAYYNIALHALPNIPEAIWNRVIKLHPSPSDFRGVQEAFFPEDRGTFIKHAFCYLSTFKGRSL